MNYITAMQYRPVWIDEAGMTQTGRWTDIGNALSTAETLRRLFDVVWVEDDEHNRI